MPPIIFNALTYTMDCCTWKEREKERTVEERWKGRTKEREKEREGMERRNKMERMSDVEPGADLRGAL